jgi:hypothetical protein
MNRRYLFILLFLIPVWGSAAPPGQVTARIIIDQFGYLPEMVKVAIISDPQQGFNEAEAYLPGTMLEVRKFSDNELVFSGAVTAWKNGTTHDQSGDKIWWFDFSTVTCLLTSASMCTKKSPSKLRECFITNAAE